MRKKNWVMAKSATLELGGQVVAVGRPVGRARVQLGMGGHADREAADGLGQLDQLEGVARARPRLGGLDGRVAAERQHVLDAGLAVVDEDLGQLEPAVGDAGEVRHGRERRGAQHADHEVVGAPARLRPPRR